MFKHVACALVMTAACGGGGGTKPQPTTQAPPSNKADAPSAACNEDVGKLAAWLKDLVADGHVPFQVSGMTLAKSSAPATPIPTLPLVSVKPNEISFQGQLLADPSQAKPAALGKAL